MTVQSQSVPRARNGHFTHSDPIVLVLMAIPVSLIILPSLWTGPKAAMAMAREQGLV